MTGRRRLQGGRQGVGVGVRALAGRASASAAGGGSPGRQGSRETDRRAGADLGASQSVGGADLGVGGRANLGVGGRAASQGVAGRCRRAASQGKAAQGKASQGRANPRSPL